ncbi:Phosphoribosylamine--glycine ligase [Streptomyces tendae]
MKVLVIGGGAREHALCRSLSLDPDVTALHCAPGNAGIAEVAELHQVDALDGAAVTALATRLGAELVVVDRTWRTDAARLHRVLDTLGVRRAAEGAAPGTDGPTLARVLDHLTTPPASITAAPGAGAEAGTGSGPDAHSDAPHPPYGDHGDHGTPAPAADDDDLEGTTARGAALAAGLSAQLAREEAEARPAGVRAPSSAPGPAVGPDAALWDDRALPLLPLQPPRTGREILTAHITAMVCCAAMDTAGAAPALDWLDGPSLLFAGARAADLAPGVLSLVESGDPGPLRAWMTELGIRPEKPVRLV